MGKNAFDLPQKSQEQPNKNDYAVFLNGHSAELHSADDPSQMIENLADYSILLGFPWKTLPIALFVRSFGEGLWYPIQGTKDKTPMLFPSPENVNIEPKLTVMEYQEIGKKALKAYKTMLNHYRALKVSVRWNQGDETTRQELCDVEEKIVLIENAVRGTEMEILLDMKYKKGEANAVCAAEMHVSPRTLDRRIDAMATHIGQVIHTALKPRKLQELLQFGDRVE